MDTAVEIHELTKHYGSKLALDRLSLSVPAGSIFALLGENGAGKSTAIKMVTGLMPPDRGYAKILGEDCWHSSTKLRKRVGYVPERPRYYDWMSADDLGWFTSGFHGPEFLYRFRELIGHFGVPARARLSTLSKGEYAKVGLSLALAVEPEVLILDEPTGGLDLLVRREFLTSMVGLAGEGRTILIASHQIAEVERVASHVAFLHQGKLVLSMTMDELRERLVKFRLRYMGQAPDPAPLGRVLQRNGHGNLWQAVVLDPDRRAVHELRGTPGVSDVEETPLTLEEAYCALIGRKGVAE